MKHNLLFDIAKIFLTNEESEEYTEQKTESRTDFSIAPVFSSITILFFTVSSVHLRIMMSKSRKHAEAFILFCLSPVKPRASSQKIDKVLTHLGPT